MLLEKMKRYSLYLTLLAVLVCVTGTKGYAQSRGRTVTQIKGLSQVWHLSPERQVQILKAKNPHISQKQIQQIVRQMQRQIREPSLRRPVAPVSVADMSALLRVDGASVQPIYQLRRELVTATLPTWLKGARYVNVWNNLDRWYTPNPKANETTAALLWQMEEFVKHTGALPRVTIREKQSLSHYTAEERMETQLRQEVYLRLRNATGKDFAQDPDLLRLQAFMMQYVSSEEITEQLMLFLYRHGRLPRQTIPDKEPVDYSAEECFEVHLAERLEQAARDDSPTNLLGAQIRQLQETARMQPHVLVSGRPPWQADHAYVSEDPEAWDVILAFPKWFEQNRRHFTTMSDTKLAMEAVLSAVQGGTPDDNTYQVVRHLLQMTLGPLENGNLVQLFYRGKNPAIPQAQDFHQMIKIDGIRKSHAKQAFALTDIPHIEFIQNRLSLFGFILHPGVTPQEIDRVVQTLIPPGFTVRMGVHEFGIESDKTTFNFEQGRLHLHIEKIAPNGLDDFDVSYIIDLKLHELVAGKKPHQILKIYRELFSQYMSEDMISFSLQYHPLQH